jgi:cell division protein FtsQ
MAPSTGVNGTSDPGPHARPGSRWRAIFFGLAALGIIVGVAWALLGSRLLVVRSVRVTGTHRVPVSQVLAAAGVPDGTPLIRVDTGEVARRVEGIRDVASAQVSKDWPSTLVITVRERTAVVAVRMAHGYDLLDPSGVIVTWQARPPAGLPQFQTSLPGSGLAGNAGLASAAAVLSALPHWLGSAVTELSAPNPAQVTLRLRAKPGEATGVTIVWGSNSGNAQKARELSILMRDAHASYYDVSAPGSVVTR